MQIIFQVLMMLEFQGFTICKWFLINLGNVSFGLKLLLRATKVMLSSCSQLGCTEVKSNY